MIVKFETKNKWVMFGNIEQLEYEQMGNVPNRGYAGVSVYEPPDNIAPANICYELVFTQGKGDGVIVHAYAPIYIMNDNGKTIDVI